MTNKKFKNVEQSLSSMKDFGKVTKNTTSLIQKMRQDVIFTDGVYPAKLKAIIAALWGVSARCEPCLKYYTIQAKELGATEKEIGEILAIGSAMGGCVGEMWGLKAFHTFKNETTSTDSCCLSTED